MSSESSLSTHVVAAGFLLLSLALCFHRNCVVMRASSSSSSTRCHRDPSLRHCVRLSFIAPLLQPFNESSCAPFLHCAIITTLQRVVVRILPSLCHHCDPSTRCRVRPSFIALPHNPSTRQCARPSFIVPLLRPFTRCCAHPSFIAPSSQPFTALSCASFLHCAAAQPFNALLCAPFLHCAVVATLYALSCAPFLHRAIVATLQRIVMRVLPLFHRRCDPSTCRCVRPSFIVPLSRPFNA